MGNDTSSSGTAMSCPTSGRFSFPASGADQPGEWSPRRTLRLRTAFLKSWVTLDPGSARHSSAAPSDPLDAPAHVVVASPALTSFSLAIMHISLLLSDVGTILVGDAPPAQLCAQPACLSQTPALPCCKGKASKARGFSLGFSGCF